MLPSESSKQLLVPQKSKSTVVVAFPRESNFLFHRDSRAVKQFLVYHVEIQDNNVYLSLIQRIGTVPYLEFIEQGGSADIASLISEGQR